MKLFGIVILLAGLLLGARALTMDVGVDVPARNFGYGIETPAMRVANVDLMTQRQNYLIFSGILSVVGAILTGFASMRPSASRPAAQPKTAESAARTSTDTVDIKSEPGSVSICPNCRSMGSGDLESCGRCGTVFDAAAASG